MIFLFKPLEGVLYFVHTIRQLDKLFYKLSHVVFTLCDGLTNCLLYESALQSHVRLTFSRTYQTYLIRATERETVGQTVCQTVA